ncbi:MAG: hypothetical protein N2Z58_08590 [Fervidobacterium sp.]|nr:hypothetical protein [Fervidobacterium sp.]
MTCLAFVLCSLKSLLIFSIELAMTIIELVALAMAELICSVAALCSWALEAKLSIIELMLSTSLSIL